MWWHPEKALATQIPKHISMDNAAVIKAIVLCGGISRRMGTDKGLLKPEEKTWAATAADKLQQLSLPVLYSINQQQFSLYKSYFPVAELIIDDEELIVKGPLSGLLSIHKKYPSNNLLVLACDMPLMQTSLLKTLLDMALSNPNFDAWLYKNNEEPEPLCAIYSANALAKTLSLLQQGQLKKFSMKYMLEQINAFYFPLTVEQQQYFRNINTHAALNGL